MTDSPVNRTVMWLTWRQLFAKNRLLVATIMALFPALIALIFRLAAGDVPTETEFFVSTLFRDLVLSVLLPITALIFGTAAFGGEVEDGTLIYLMVKPVPRWHLALSKYLVAVTATIAVVIPS